MRCPIGILVSIPQPATSEGRIEILYSSSCHRFCLSTGFQGSILEFNHCSAAIYRATMALELLLG
jgi:hypothetical protein